MKRKLLIIVVAALLLAGCAQTEVATFNTRIWTDEETGVQYVIWSDYRGSGITPRLNIDGTVMVGGLND